MRLAVGVLRFLAPAAAAVMAVSCGTPVAPFPTITPVDQSEGAVSPVIANSELVVGTNRFLFGLLDAQNQMVDDAEVALTLVYLTDDPDAPAEASQVGAHPLTVGLDDIEETLNEPVPLLYVAQTTFSRTGRWGVEMQIQRPGHEVRISRLAFQVVEESVAPNVGDAAPASHSRTYLRGYRAESDHVRFQP